MEEAVDFYYKLSSINFYSVRWLLLAFFLLFLVIKIIKIAKKNKVSNANEITLSKKEIIVGKTFLLVIIILLFFIISEVYFRFAFENTFLKFNSIEEVQKYYYPTERILKKIKVDNKITIIIAKDKTYERLSMHYFINEKNKWNIDNIKYKGDSLKVSPPLKIMSNPSTAFNALSFEIICFDSINKTYIMFSDSFIADKDGKEPFDSEKSKYRKIEIPLLNSKANYYIFEVDKIIDKKYTIYYNGVKYSGLLKNKN